MILLVEDEAITRSAFADALRREGQEVIQAATGIRALSLLDKIPRRSCHHRPSDAETQRFRPSQPNPLKVAHIPILFISAYISQDAARISDGNAEFIRKPIDPPDLIATVRRLLPTPR